MTDIESLSCKEDLQEFSDLDHSTNEEHKDVDEKPKKKKRRRRELDMILQVFDEDESDEEICRKKIKLQSPDPAHREPRTCVLKASQKRRPLSRLLEQLLRNLEKKDPHQFFAWPVNDNFAPNYSNIIRKPMDFSSIKQKIDDNAYKSLNCFISDFKLMCNNAMKYNKPGTVYHKAAKRLLHAGLKQLTPHKLRPLGNILTYMYEIPIRELGFDIGKMDLHAVLKRGSGSKGGSWEGEGEVEEGGERGDHVKIQMERARELHRRRLAKKAFPRMDSDGKTTMCLVTAESEDKNMTLGQYIGKLTSGTGTLNTTREDRRNLIKGVKSLYYGPYSSYAPTYDSTFSTLTKEESHLLYHTLPTETGQGCEESLRFAADSPWSAIYDMEEMFPDKKQANEQTDKAREDVPQVPDISKRKVDVEQLRSLSELGIDVEFLNDMEEDIIASQRDYGITNALQQTYQLLMKLEKEQRDRLSLPPPAHLSLSRGPGALERECARTCVSGLRAMSARVPPALLVPVPALHKAMGVTLHHLDTPMSLDELVEPTGDSRDSVV